MGLAPMNGSTPACRFQQINWRAHSAVITGLYVPEEAAGVAAELSHVYGAPCEVGYPNCYSKAEWDARARLDGHRVDADHDLTYPSFAEFGLHPARRMTTGTGRDDQAWRDYLHKQATEFPRELARCTCDTPSFNRADHANGCALSLAPPLSSNPTRPATRRLPEEMF